MTNPTGLQMLGCTPEEAPGYDITATHLPEDRPAYRNRIEQIKTGQPLHFERTFLRKDGSTLPVEVLVSPIRNGCSQAVLRDIRERKRAQEALQRSEFYLSEAEKLSHAGSWALDARRPATSSTGLPKTTASKTTTPPSPSPPSTKERSKYRPEDWMRIQEALEQTVHAQDQLRSRVAPHPARWHHTARPHGRHIPCSTRPARSSRSSAPPSTSPNKPAPAPPSAKPSHAVQRSRGSTPPHHRHHPRAGLEHRPPMAASSSSTSAGANTPDSPSIRCAAGPGCP